MYDPSVYLLNAARKSWQHIVSDEVVYLLNPVKVDGDPSISLSENYARGTSWCEALIRSGANYLAAIFSRCDVIGVNLVNDRSHRPDGDSPVLVDPVHLMKLPQKVSSDWYPCRSVVWLKRFEDVDSFRRYSLRVSDEGFPVSGVVDLEDRELRPVGIGMTDVRERPNGLIQSRSEALEDVSRDEKEVDVGMLKRNSITSARSFSILIGHNCVGIRRNEPKDSCTEIIQMNFRPLGLPVRIS